MQINPEQELHEWWWVKFTRAPKYGDHLCHIYISHPIVVTSSGKGNNIEQARIDALIKLAAGYIALKSRHDDDSDWEVSDQTLEYIEKQVNAEKKRRAKKGGMNVRTTAKAK